MKTFFFFLESTCACVLGLESVCPRKGCPWPWPRIYFVSLALASSLVSSTPPLILAIVNHWNWLDDSQPLNQFLLDGCRSSFKSEGITILAYSLDL